MGFATARKVIKRETPKDHIGFWGV
jgi:hypothetical protein